ncbi:hypothetical protein EVAR_26716_1 [Eumeta japonica]|uniref:Retrovirus-related Pol polyprotein from type-1 retrotransposable element R1 n=1 Tax=Eumeta variegata TaxID=151549 RepID=A0A4C1XCX9_EUMVA|nr:hypothetical protein EVAR_26716_1 [Eumeta japonica]
MTSLMAQTLTGHGGFAQYLHRFKLKDSPYCACDPAEIQDVLHVLTECPMFLWERVALEMEIGVTVGKREFPTIIDDDKIRERFSKFVNPLESIFNSLDENSWWKNRLEGQRGLPVLSVPQPVWKDDKIIGKRRREENEGKNETGRQRGDALRLCSFDDLPLTALSWYIYNLTRSYCAAVYCEKGGGGFQMVNRVCGVRPGNNLIRTTSRSQDFVASRSH